MFYGEYNHSLDEKGRLIMPVKFRDQLGGHFFITKDLWNKEDEKCLFVYTESSFNELADKLRNMHSSKEDIRRSNRRFFSSVQDGETDKQGRVLLTSELRQYAGIKQKIVLAGLDDHIEIWDKESWDKYNDEAEDVYASGILEKSFDENGI